MVQQITTQQTTDYTYNQQHSGFGNTYMFTGRRFDNPTGLYYYRNRYYEPQTGKFVSRDPKGYMDGINLYSYVINNSINWIDPYGLNGEDKKGYPETFFEWLRKLFGASYKSGRGPNQGLRTPQTPMPLTGIGQQLLTPEGAEAQRGGIEFARRAQRDKEIAGEAIYGTYSPLTESGNTLPQPASMQRPANQEPAAPPASSNPRPTRDSGSIFSPRTRELIEAEKQLFKVNQAFVAVGKQWDDLICDPGLKHEYEAARFRVISQYFLLRNLINELRGRINKLK